MVVQQLAGGISFYEECDVIPEPASLQTSPSAALIINVELPPGQP